MGTGEATWQHFLVRMRETTLVKSWLVHGVYVLTKMRVVALISGGKDSCYNMMKCVAAGHEIVALANLQPRKEQGGTFLY